MNPSSSNALRHPPVDEADLRGAPSGSSASTETSSDAASAASMDHDGGAAGRPGAEMAPAEEKLLTTGEMARLSNSTLRTVRFYEEEGILRPAKRTDGGHRLFRRAELDRLLFVTDLRTAGLSLDEIKEILELKRGSSSGPQAAKIAMRIFSSRIKELEEKVAVLARLRDEFTQTTDIVAACLKCNDHEAFPAGCGTCTVMSSHTTLPRSTRVVWAVGSMPSAPQSISGESESRAKASKEASEPNGSGGQSAH